MRRDCTARRARSRARHGAFRSRVRRMTPAHPRARTRPAPQIVIGLLVAVFVIPAAIVTADSLQRWVGERWHCAKRPRREASTASVDSQRSGVGVRLVLH